MVSEIQLDDAEIEAHLFNRTSNRDNASRMTGKMLKIIIRTLFCLLKTNLRLSI